LFNQRLAQKLIDPETGELLAGVGDVLDRRLLDKLLPSLEKNVSFRSIEPAGGVVDDAEINIQSIRVFSPDDADGEQVINIIGNGAIDETVKNITAEDIIASINYFFNLLHGVGNTDDIDHLGNRRLRSVGELLQNQFRIGLSRMEREIGRASCRERE